MNRFFQVLLATLVAFSFDVFGQSAASTISTPPPAPKALGKASAKAVGTTPALPSGLSSFELILDINLLAKEKMKVHCNNGTVAVVKISDLPTTDAEADVLCARR